MKIYEQLEVSIQEFEQQNSKLCDAAAADKAKIRRFVLKDLEWLKPVLSVCV